MNEWMSHFGHAFMSWVINCLIFILLFSRWILKQFLQNNIHGTTQVIMSTVIRSRSLILNFWVHVSSNQQHSERYLQHFWEKLLLLPCRLDLLIWFFLKFWYSFDNFLFFNLSFYRLNKEKQNLQWNPSIFLFTSTNKRGGKKLPVKSDH